MPTTEEYWDVDGVSLNELTQNLSSWGGSREGAPPVRGTNVVIPGRPGAVWVPKDPGERQLVLTGWMVGQNAQELRTRWRAFRALLWRPHELFAITRRWKDAGGVQRQATALVEYLSGMEPVITSGGTRAEFSVTLNMPDPFFYGPLVELASYTAAGTKPLTVLGDYSTRKILVELTGAQSAAALTVRKGGTIDNTLKYSALASGVATIDVERFRASELIDVTTTRTSGKVSHTGRVPWLWLPPGPITLQYARSGSVGTAKVSYQPAWH